MYIYMIYVGQMAEPQQLHVQQQLQQFQAYTYTTTTTTTTTVTSTQKMCNQTSQRDVTYDAVQV